MKRGRPKGSLNIHAIQKIKHEEEVNQRLLDLNMPNTVSNRRASECAIAREKMEETLVRVNAVCKRSSSTECRDTSGCKHSDKVGKCNVGQKICSQNASGDVFDSRSLKRPMDNVKKPVPEKKKRSDDYDKHSSSKKCNKEYQNAPQGECKKTSVFNPRTSHLCKVKGESSCSSSKVNDGRHSRLDNSFHKTDTYKDGHSSDFRKSEDSKDDKKHKRHFSHHEHNHGDRKSNSSLKHHNDQEKRRKSIHQEDETKTALNRTKEEEEVDNFMWSNKTRILEPYHHNMKNLEDRGPTVLKDAKQTGKPTFHCLISDQPMEGQLPPFKREVDSCTGTCAKIPQLLPSVPERPMIESLVDNLFAIFSSFMTLKDTICKFRKTKYYSDKLILEMENNLQNIAISFGEQLLKERIFTLENINLFLQRIVEKSSNAEVTYVLPQVLDGMDAIGRILQVHFKEEQCIYLFQSNIAKIKKDSAHQGSKMYSSQNHTLQSSKPQSHKSSSSDSCETLRNSKENSSFSTSNHNPHTPDTSNHDSAKVLVETKSNTPTQTISLKTQDRKLDKRTKLNQTIYKLKNIARDKHKKTNYLEKSVPDLKAQSKSLTKTPKLDAVEENIPKPVSKPPEIEQKILAPSLPSLPSLADAADCNTESVFSNLEQSFKSSNEKYIIKKFGKNISTVTKVNSTIVSEKKEEPNDVSVSHKVFKHLPNLTTKSSRLAQNLLKENITHLNENQITLYKLSPERTIINQINSKSTGHTSSDVVLNKVELDTTNKTSNNKKLESTITIETQTSSCNVPSSSAISDIKPSNNLNSKSTIVNKKQRILKTANFDKAASNSKNFENQSNLNAEISHSKDKQKTSNTSNNEITNSNQINNSLNAKEAVPNRRNINNLDNLGILNTDKISHSGEQSSLNPLNIQKTTSNQKINTLNVEKAVSNGNSKILENQSILNTETTSCSRECEKQSSFNLEKTISSQTNKALNCEKTVPYKITDKNLENQNTFNKITVDNPEHNKITDTSFKMNDNVIAFNVVFDKSAPNSLNPNIIITKVQSENQTAKATVDDAISTLKSREFLNTNVAKTNEDITSNKFATNISMSKTSQSHMNICNQVQIENLDNTLKDSLSEDLPKANKNMSRSGELSVNGINSLSCIPNLPIFNGNDNNLSSENSINVLSNSKESEQKSKRQSTSVESEQQVNIRPLKDKNTDNTQSTLQNAKSTTVQQLNASITAVIAQNKHVNKILNEIYQESVTQRNVTSINTKSGEPAVNATPSAFQHQFNTVTANKNVANANYDYGRQLKQQSADFSKKSQCNYLNQNVPQVTNISHDNPNAKQTNKYQAIQPKHQNTQVNLVHPHQNYNLLPNSQNSQINQQIPLQMNNNSVKINENSRNSSNTSQVNQQQHPHLLQSQLALQMNQNSMCLNQNLQYVNQQQLLKMQNSAHPNITLSRMNENLFQQNPVNQNSVNEQNIKLYHNIMRQPNMLANQASQTPAHSTNIRPASTRDNTVNQNNLMPLNAQQYYNPTKEVISAMPYNQNLVRPILQHNQNLPRSNQLLENSATNQMQSNNLNSNNLKQRIQMAGSSRKYVRNILPNETSGNLQTPTNIQQNTPVQQMQYNPNLAQTTESIEQQNRMLHTNTPFIQNKPPPAYSSLYPQMAEVPQNYTNNPQMQMQVLNFITNNTHQSNNQQTVGQNQLYGGVCVQQNHTNNVNNRTEGRYYTPYDPNQYYARQNNVSQYNNLRQITPQNQVMPRANAPYNLNRSNMQIQSNNNAMAQNTTQYYLIKPLNNPQAARLVPIRNVIQTPNYNMQHVNPNQNINIKPAFDNQKVVSDSINSNMSNNASFVHTNTFSNISGVNSKRINNACPLENHQMNNLQTVNNMEPSNNFPVNNNLNAINNASCQNIDFNDRKLYWKTLHQPETPCVKIKQPKLSEPENHNQQSDVLANSNNVQPSQNVDNAGSGNVEISNPILQDNNSCTNVFKYSQQDTQNTNPLNNPQEARLVPISNVIQTPNYNMQRVNPNQNINIKPAIYNQKVVNDSINSNMSINTSFVHTNTFSNISGVNSKRINNARPLENHQMNNLQTVNNMEPSNNFPVNNNLDATNNASCQNIDINDRRLYRKTLHQPETPFVKKLPKLNEPENHNQQSDVLANSNNVQPSQNVDNAGSGNVEIPNPILQDNNSCTNAFKCSQQDTQNTNSSDIIKSKNCNSTGTVEDSENTVSVIKEAVCQSNDAANSVNIISDVVVNTSAANSLEVTCADEKTVNESLCQHANADADDFVFEDVFDVENCGPNVEKDVAFEIKENSFNQNSVDVINAQQMEVHDNIVNNTDLNTVPDSINSIETDNFANKQNKTSIDNNENENFAHNVCLNGAIEINENISGNTSGKIIASRSATPILNELLPCEKLKAEVLDAVCVDLVASKLTECDNANNNINTNISTNDEATAKTGAILNNEASTKESDNPDAESLGVQEITNTAGVGTSDKTDSTGSTGKSPAEIESLTGVIDVENYVPIDPSERIICLDDYQVPSVNAIDNDDSILIKTEDEMFEFDNKNDIEFISDILCSSETDVKQDSDKDEGSTMFLTDLIDAEKVGIKSNSEVLDLTEDGDVVIDLAEDDKCETTIPKIDLGRLDDDDDVTVILDVKAEKLAGEDLNERLKDFSDVEADAIKPDCDIDVSTEQYSIKIEKSIVELPKLFSGGELKAEANLATHGKEKKELAVDDHISPRMCFCGKNIADLLCQCTMAIYCSKECQRMDWKRHEPDCLEAGQNIFVI